MDVFKALAFVARCSTFNMSGILPGVLVVQSLVYSGEELALLETDLATGTKAMHTHLQQVDEEAAEVQSNHRPVMHAINHWLLTSCL
eukprot:3316803-Amphidinium_carterae.1